LAHGVFQLRHTFSSKYGIEKNTTNNLMDYAGGTELTKYQWDVLFDAQNLIAKWVQKEGEGAMTFNDERDMLLGLMNTIGSDAFLFLKKCDKVELPDKMVFKLGDNYYRGVVGKYTSTGNVNVLDGIIPKQDIEKKYTNIEIPVDKEEFIILGKGNEAVICETYEDYSEFCNIKDNSKSDDFLAKWTKDISKCVTDNLKQDYDAEIAIGDMSDGELVQITNDLKELLSIAYFNNIKIGINIRTSNGESSTLSNTANPEEVEIQLDYYIDYVNNQVLVKETVKDKFYESSKLALSLRETAGKKNIPIDELREDALMAFRDLKDERIDYGSGFSAKIREFFTSHAKAIQITGKVGKNIWEESTIPNGVWYSQGEGREYYKGSFEVPNIPSGVVDGVIGEVLSMPIMIKTAGEIVLNKEKAQAFGAIFTADGFTKMLKGIKDDFVESMQDEEKRPYTISKTTVEVGSMFLGTGWVKGANKAGKEVAGETVEALQKIPGGVKIAEGIPASKIKKLTEQLQKLTEKADSDKIVDRIGDFSEATRLKFVDDLVSDPNFYKKIIDNPEIIDLFQLHKKIDDILPSEFERLREIADKLDDDLVNKWASYGDEMNTLLKRFKKAGLIEDEALEILSKNYDNFVQQVTIDVILPAVTKVPDGVKSLKIPADGSGRKQITTIVDGVGKKEGKIFFHEVKASSKIIDNADELLTTQQKFFKEVLEGKVTGELIPRGEHAATVFEEMVGKNIANSPRITKKLNIEVKDLPLN
jgi:hypothetical protein